jgi:hypothetical protein
MVKRTNKPAKRKAVRKPRPMSRLDVPALEYAKLLADPCTGRLVHPIYAGGDAGYLFRAESFATFGTGTGNTAGTVHWVPGYVNASGTDLVGIAATSGNTAAAAVALGNTFAPGRTFLNTNARGVRCVAACMKITYPGNESVRSGRIHYGLTTAGLIDAATSHTADGVAQALQHFTRTPPETIELVWRPGAADTEFNDPTEQASAAIRDRKAAITVAWAGLPDAVGLTIHFTAIYEWTPTFSAGVAHNSMGKAISRNTLDDVIDYLKNAGFNFVRQLNAHSGGQLGVALASGVYGLMSARPSRRAIAFN